MKESATRSQTHQEFVALLVEDEYCARRNRRLARQIARASFKPEGACLQNVRYEKTRGFEKKEILQFSTPAWIDNAMNVILKGPTGCGKSYLSEAIGLAACTIGQPARKIRFA